MWMKTTTFYRDFLLRKIYKSDVATRNAGKYYIKFSKFYFTPYIFSCQVAKKWLKDYIF